MSWDVKPLDEVVEHFIDYRGKTPNKTNQGIPLITAKIVKDGRLLEANEYIAEEDYDEWMTRGYPEIDDVVLTTEAPLGEVALIKDKNVALAQRIITLRGYRDKLDNKFLKYWFQSEYGQYELDSRASGTTVFGIKASVLKKVPLPVPPLPEQKAIASVLSSLDDKIDLLHRQNKTLEAMAETLLIQHVLPREDEQNDGLYLLGDYLETISVTHKFPNPQVVFLNTSDIYKGKVLTHELSEVKGLPGQAKKSIKKGDILFSEIRPANGRYALIDFDADNYVVSTKLMVLRAKQPNLIGLLYFYLTNKQVTDWLQVLAESRSGTFPQITFDQVADLELRLPQGSDLDNLIGLLDDILLKQSANNKQIQTLENLRDTLLPKLMSGEVRVQYQTEEVA
ncbi:restriction endonuclease subunit S [Acinetobacter baumannii]|nr:restriction endonuclease subunit S [Acinetobacter baumannii]